MRQYKKSSQNSYYIKDKIMEAHWIKNILKKIITTLTFFLRFVRYKLAVVSYKFSFAFKFESLNLNFFGEKKRNCQKSQNCKM